MRAVDEGVRHDGPKAHRRCDVGIAERDCDVAFSCRTRSAGHAAGRSEDDGDHDLVNPLGRLIHTLLGHGPTHRTCDYLTPTETRTAQASNEVCQLYQVLIIPF